MVDFAPGSGGNTRPSDLISGNSSDTDPWQTADGIVGVGSLSLLSFMYNSPLLYAHEAQTSFRETNGMPWAVNPTGHPCVALKFPL